MSNTNPNMLTIAQLKEMNITDVFGVAWDQIEEAQGIIVPPEGSYILDIIDCKIEHVGKDDAKKEGLQFTFSVASTLELVDANETPVAEGSEFKITYIGGQSVSYMKRDFAQVAEALAPQGLQDFIARVKGCKVVAILTHRINKDNPSQRYPQISDVTLA